MWRLRPGNLALWRKSVCPELRSRVGDWPAPGGNVGHLSTCWPVAPRSHPDAELSGRQGASAPLPPGEPEARQRAEGGSCFTALAAGAYTALRAVTASQNVSAACPSWAACSLAHKKQVQQLGQRGDSVLLPLCGRARSAGAVG